MSEGEEVFMPFEGLNKAIKEYNAKPADKRGQFLIIKDADGKLYGALNVNYFISATELK
jgi:hypothetical protein